MLRHAECHTAIGRVKVVTQYKKTIIRVHRSVEISPGQYQALTVGNKRRRETRCAGKQCVRGYSHLLQQYGCTCVLAVILVIQIVDSIVGAAKRTADENR